MTGAPGLSIVIPAFNEERCIGDCLRSLARQVIGLSFEVVLVDNNSTDATVRVARATTNGLQLRVVHESRQGRGAARHAGFATAHGMILVSADADTTYPSRWLRGLLDGLASDDVVAVTTTARIDDLGWWRNAAFNIGQPLAMWCFRFVHGHHCLSGFSFAIRRGVYEASGGFDPNLNAEEDADLSRRVARLGKIKLLHAPVTFSGRRFRSGLLVGAIDYARTFWQYRSGRTSAHLDDVR